MPKESISGSLYNTLKKHLPVSIGADRKTWAELIIANDIDIMELTKLLGCERGVATRFLWLLSDVGEVKPDVLFRALPYLFELSKGGKYFDFTLAFARWWRLTGVPEENEGEAIGLLFEWLSSDVNVSIKSCVIIVLYELSGKYPELKDELRLCLEDRLGKETKDFNKKLLRMLEKLT